MAQKTDLALTNTLASNVTTPLNGQNTATRVIEVFQDIIDSKVNKYDAVKVTNNIFVDSTYGADATGEVENQAKPFATIAAAHAAGAAYWTGGTAPSATNIVTMNINGYFAEPLEILSYYNYNLNSSVIEDEINDGGVAATCSIYGAATVGVSNSTAIYCTAGSDLTLKIDNIYGDIQMINNASKIKIYNANILATSSRSNFSLCTGSIKSYNCYIASVSGENIALSTEGTYEFNNCTIASASLFVVDTTTTSNSSYLTFNNCYLHTGGTNLSTINLRTNTGSNVTLTIKDCTLIANGSGNSIRAAQATNVYVYGSCQTNLTHDTGDVTLLVGTVANGRFLIDAAVI